MHDFSIPMALVDYIPVIFFALASIILLRDLYHKMSKAAFALFSAGVINVTIAGALKATWKLLYAANICDFASLNAIAFGGSSLLIAVGIVLETAREIEAQMTMRNFKGFLS